MSLSNVDVVAWFYCINGTYVIQVQTKELFGLISDNFRGFFKVKLSIQNFEIVANSYLVFPCKLYCTRTILCKFMQQVLSV